MSRFTVWSPHDGQPLPVRNARERDALIQRGYLDEKPEQSEEEQDEPSTVAGADSGGLPADSKPGRVRGRQKPVAGELGGDADGNNPVPSPVE